jgi:hypothetical protein
LIGVSTMRAERLLVGNLRRSGWAVAAAIVGFFCFALSGPADAQVDTSKPIAIRTKAPKANTAKFSGTVVHANTVQITVRGRDNEMVVRTFPLSTEMSARMQIIVDHGGYQFGDKVTVVYDPITNRALKIKGKPSRPI